MPVLSRVLLPLVFAANACLCAGETDVVGESAPTDPLAANLDGAIRTHFKDATVLKAERKERDSITGNLRAPNFLALPLGEIGTKAETVYTLTLSDALNKKIEVVFNASGELVSADKYRTTLEMLPRSVQAAVAKQVPDSEGASDPLEVKVEKSVYKVSGRIKGRKVNIETIVVADVSKIPSNPPYTPRQPTPPIIEPSPEPDASAGKSAKPEIAAHVDGPFRALFKDAKILSVDRKEATGVTVHVFSFGGGGIRYEVTLSDPLNKKFKVVFTESGQIYSATKYMAPFERLPTEVQSAIEKLTPVSDRSQTVEVRVDHKSTPREHEEYKVTAKINGTKIDVEVPLNRGR